MKMLNKIKKILLVIATVMGILVSLCTIYGYFRKWFSINSAVFTLIALVLFLSGLIVYLIYLVFTAPSIEYARSEDESKKHIKQIHKRLECFLKKNKMIEVYEANLDTGDPGGVLAEDKDLAIKNSGLCVKWKMVIFKTEAKTQWVDEWKKEIWSKNENCELHIVKLKAELSNKLNLNKWHMLNFLSIPDISEAYIGYGRYPGFQGGGIRIRDKRISMEIKGIVDNWGKAAQKEERLT